MTNHGARRDRPLRRRPPHAPSPVRGLPRRTASDIVQGVAAILVLAVFVVGIPVVLLVVSPVASISAPGWSDITDALTQPDDGHLFLAMLSLVAWLAWAAFAVCVVVEAVAAIRGIPSPRLPLLGTPQRTAGALVAAAAVVLTVQPVPAIPVSANVVSTSPVSTAPLTAVGLHAEAHSASPPVGDSAMAEANPVRGATSRLTSLDSTARAARHQTVKVRRGHTLWRLAEQHLGSGSRYREIAELNYGVAQPDGRALTDAHWIYPDWVLRMPADATGVSQVSPNGKDEPTSHAAAVEGHYTVQQGDSLWGIAERQLGDGQRYREVYQLNAGRAQDVGGRLADPEVILPGWVLRMPAAGSPGHVPAHKPEVGSTSPHSPPTREPSDEEPAERPPSGTPPPGAEDRDHGGAAGISTNTDELDQPASQLNQLFLGLTVLASAGLLGEVARRRRRQQRLRQPGERISLPEGEAARVEQTLRSVQDPVSLGTLRVALASLATNCRTMGRDLPRVLAILMSPDRLDVLTDDEGEAVEPFGVVGPGVWRLERSSLTGPSDASDQLDPCPVLVTVGVAGDSLVLLNLEAAGTLTVLGEDPLVEDVVRALALELATSPTAGGAVLVLPDALSELVEVSDISRVERAEPDDALRRADAHATTVAALIAESGVSDLHEARSQGVAADAWTPVVFVTSHSIDAVPWSGTAVITTGAEAGSGWTLTLEADGRGRLDPLGIDLDVQRLTAADYASVINILGSADGHSQQPRPQAVDEPALGATTSRSSEDVQQVVLAALPCPSESLLDDRIESLEAPAPPRVLVLGRVEIEGMMDGATSGRRARATEFVAYLALHSGGSAHEVDEAIWPGRRVTKQTRNSFVSRVRQWLGTTPTGEPYLPLVGDHGDYRMSPTISCDWQDFLRLARDGLASDYDGAESLEQALVLVRGRPFLGIDPTTYVWAEADAQEMIGAIVDVAHVLSTTRLEQGDARAAQDAAARGLLVEPGSELLHCDAIRAAAARGDSLEIARLSDRLRAQIETMDPDGGVGDDTAELLRRVAVNLR